MDAKAPRFFKSPSFPLLSKGNEGGFLDFLRALRLGDNNFVTLVKNIICGDNFSDFGA
jgi:hypothetical protein